MSLLTFFFLCIVFISGNVKMLLLFQYEELDDCVSITRIAMGLKVPSS